MIQTDMTADHRCKRGCWGECETHHLYIGWGECVDMSGGCWGECGDLVEVVGVSVVT